MITKKCHYRAFTATSSVSHNPIPTGLPCMSDDDRQGRISSPTDNAITGNEWSAQGTQDIQSWHTHVMSTVAELTTSSGPTTLPFAGNFTGAN